MSDTYTDILKAFNEGRYLDVIAASDSLDDPEDRLLLGIACYKMGRMHKAREIFEDISVLVSSLIRAQYYMAMIYQAQGAPEAARACVERYTLFHPDDDEALDLLDQTQPEEALLWEASPELAKLYASQGHYRQALDIYAALVDDSDDGSLRREALKVQQMHIIKTLESWRERMKT